MAVAAKRITRDDIEAKLREVAGDVDSGVESVKPKLITAGVAAAVLALLVAYLLGRKGGRHRSAVVEIRRL
jgi:hypothetical protein